MFSDYFSPKMDSEDSEEENIEFNLDSGIWSWIIFGGREGGGSKVEDEEEEICTSLFKGTDFSP